MNLQHLGDHAPHMRTDTARPGVSWGGLRANVLAIAAELLVAWLLWRVFA